MSGTGGRTEPFRQGPCPLRVYFLPGKGDYKWETNVTSLEEWSDPWPRVRVSQVAGHFDCGSGRERHPILWDLKKSDPSDHEPSSAGATNTILCALEFLGNASVPSLLLSHFSRGRVLRSLLFFSLDWIDDYVFWAMSISFGWVINYYIP